MSEWKDWPNDDGLWLRCFVSTNTMQLVEVCMQRNLWWPAPVAAGSPSGFAICADSKWMKAPPPPPKPLPKSREVTLTARVERISQGWWRVSVMAGDTEICAASDVVKDYAIELARKRYGLEPEVKDE